MFEEANQGTIFIDEIGEMAMDLQAKILRVLEAREFIKIGETKPTKVDVRVIAATNRELEKEIENGLFRSDLYYRLSVFQIILPSLRDRVGDIKLFANDFAQVFAAKMNKQVKSLSSEYIKVLEQNTWRGNIRELRNIIERSVILADTEELTVDCLPFELQQPDTSDTATSFLSMTNIEKSHIKKVLNYTKGNKAEAARLLEISIATLYRKVEEYKL